MKKTLLIKRANSDSLASRIFLLEIYSFVYQYRCKTAGAPAQITHKKINYNWNTLIT
jgi:hypothetical protein